MSTNFLGREYGMLLNAVPTGNFQPAHGAAVLALCRHDAAAAPDKADHARCMVSSANVLLKSGAPENKECVSNKLELFNL